MSYLEARVERYYTRGKVGIKILIGTSICIIGASVDETSLMSTVAQHDVRYNYYKAITLREALWTTIDKRTVTLVIFGNCWSSYSNYKNDLSYYICIY